MGNLNLTVFFFLRNCSSAFCAFSRGQAYVMSCTSKYFFGVQTHKRGLDVKGDLLLARRGKCVFFFVQLFLQTHISMWYVGLPNMRLSSGSFLLRKRCYVTSCFCFVSVCG